MNQVNAECEHMSEFATYIYIIMFYLEALIINVTEKKKRNRRKIPWNRGYTASE